MPSLNGNVVYLLGAGASHGSGCEPEEPPLGNSTGNKSGLFVALQSFHPFFKTIPTQLAEEFSANFEKGMISWLGSKKNQPDNIAQVGLFSALLGQYFSSFKPLKQNSYRTFLDSVRPHAEQSVIVSTNYDMLLERSLISTPGKYRIDFLGNDFLSGNFPRCLLYLKPHGACNFLPPLEALTNVGTNNVVMGALPGQGTGRTPVMYDLFIEIDDARLSRYYNCSDQAKSTWPPTIATYGPGKEFVASSDHMSKILARTIQVISTAKSIVVSGLALNEADEHIWGAVRKSGAPLLVADPYPEKILQWATSAGLQVSVVASTFQDLSISLPTIAEGLYA